MFKIKGSCVVDEIDIYIILNVGEYSKVLGEVIIICKNYLLVFNKMVKLYKVINNSLLFWLNIFFGISLLFFVIFVFLMFIFKLFMYKNGLKIVGIGVVVIVFVVVFGF